jgi:hypothetical protein
MPPNARNAAARALFEQTIVRAFAPDAVNGERADLARKGRKVVIAAVVFFLLALSRVYSEKQLAPTLIGAALLIVGIALLLTLQRYVMLWISCARNRRSRRRLLAELRTYCAAAAEMDRWRRQQAQHLAGADVRALAECISRRLDSKDADGVGSEARLLSRSRSGLPTIEVAVYSWFTYERHPGVWISYRGGPSPIPAPQIDVSARLRLVVVAPTETELTTDRLRAVEVRRSSDVQILATSEDVYGRLDSARSMGIRTHSPADVSAMLCGFGLWLELGRWSVAPSVQIGNTGLGGYSSFVGPATRFAEVACGVRAIADLEALVGAEVCASST